MKPHFEVVQQLVTFYADSQSEVLQYITKWLKENEHINGTDILIHIYENTDSDGYIGQVRGDWEACTLKEVRQKLK